MAKTEKEGVVKSEARDKGRRNDLKWSRGQESLWPEAAVFLPTRSAPPPPIPPTTTALASVVAVISFLFLSNVTHVTQTKT